VPANAGWCSLCHGDLRPEPERTPVAPPSTDVAPGTDAGAAGIGAAGRHRRRDADEPGAPAVEEPMAAPRRGRARTSSGGGSGRHAAGRRPSRTEAAVLAEGYAVHASTMGTAPVVPDAEREEVERLADSMLSRLAVVESSETLFDPREVPGGRWGFAAAVALVITVVLLLGSVIINLVVNR
jgi:hypothetical protein